MKTGPPFFHTRLKYIGKKKENGENQLWDPQKDYYAIYGSLWYVNCLSWKKKIYMRFLFKYLILRSNTSTPIIKRLVVFTCMVNVNVCSLVPIALNVRMLPLWVCVYPFYSGSCRFHFFCSIKLFCLREKNNFKKIIKMHFYVLFVSWNFTGNQ